MHIKKFSDCTYWLNSAYFCFTPGTPKVVDATVVRIVHPVKELFQPNTP